MSLGVLNNLTAMYAENNLNNTSNSLSKVLNQLSSGSKINSGADDAAGLSLVDGLQANSVALAQSQTNAQEGVGLLQVADGALSQVTSLLNRAVTLVTEASNGTLNSSQDSAANNEYQSILSEINNIGATTTYNATSVFGHSATNIYTGDSSTQGASIDSLNISSLSSSSLGDTGGVMSYSNGQSSVFLNLSSSTKNAQSTDTLNAAGSSTINVNYLVKGAAGTSTAASTSITVGTGTNYSNTADGLISAINGAGLGLSANFDTQAQSGVSGGGTQTGIQITGGLVSVGVDPSSSTTSGTLNPSEITNGDLALGQTITVNTGTAIAASVTLDQTDNTLAGLAAKINSGTGGAGGVTATVIYNSAGTATSLKLADSTNTGGALSITTANASVVPNALTPGTAITSASNPSAVTFTAGQTGATGAQGTATLSIGGTGSNSSTQALTGSIALANGVASETFTMGTGASDTIGAGTITLSAAHSTVTGLASAISTYLGASAVASSSGIAITSTATGTNITQTSSTLTAALPSAVTSNVAGLAATAGSDGSTVLSMSNAAAFKSDGSDALTGTIKLQNGSGAQYTFTMGSSAGVVGTTYTTGTQNVTGLVGEINASTATTGMTASISNGTIVVGSNIVNTTITASNSTLAGTTNLASAAGSPAFGTGQAPTTNGYSTVSILTATGNPANNSLTTTGDTLAGSMTITNNGVTDTFTMGAGTNTATSFFTGASTLASLQSTITGAANLGVTATADSTAGGTSSGLTLTANAYGTTIAIGGAGIVDTSTVGTDAQTSIGNELTNTLSADDSGKLGAAVGLSGSFVIAETGTGVNGGTANLNVVVGAAGKTTADNTTTTVYVQGTAGVGAGVATTTQIAAAINTFIGTVGNTGGKNFDVNASVDANTGGLTVQAGAISTTDSALSIGTSTLTAAQTLTAGAVTAGSTAGEAQVALSDPQGGAISASDTLTQGTSILLTNTASGVQTTFTMGGVTSGTTIGVGTAGSQSTQTVQALMTAINGAGLDLQAGISNGKLTITSTGASNTGTVTVGGATNLSEAYTAAGSSSTAGTAATSATSAAVSINTTAKMSTTGNDALGGQIILTNSSNGTAVTFNLSNAGTSSGNTVDLATGSSTVNNLVTAINNNTTLGITASVNSTTGALQLQSNATDTNITVGGTGLTDATSEVLTPGTSGSASADSTGTVNLVSGNFTGANALTGSISVSANGATTNYVMAGSNATFSSGTTVHLSAANSTVTGFEAALTANQGLSTSVSNGAMTLTSGTADANAIGVSNNNLSDTLGYAAATASLGTFSSEADTVSGQLNYNVGSTAYALGSVAGMTANQLINEVNYGNTAGTGTAGANGVTASWVSSGNGTFGSIQMTSNTYGATGNITNQGSGTSINDLGISATLSYAAASAYSTGISNVATTGVYDSSTQSVPSGVSAPYANLTASKGGTSGIATMSYSDGAGQSLSATDLSNQTDAESALTSLNTAITDVAAQDGYIGAQINTLNAVSSVLSTQQQNVVSAQNAVQATDYASATSNMSKYEILSQTGIAALAQANSLSQEVTKLLQ